MKWQLWGILARQANRAPDCVGHTLLEKPQDNEKIGKAHDVVTLRYSRSASRTRTRLRRTHAARKASKLMKKLAKHIFFINFALS